MRSCKIKLQCLFFILYLIPIQAQDSLYLNYTLLRESKGDGFGKVVRALGDVNNDGYPDFAIAAPDSEYVKVFFGDSPFDINNYLRIQIKGTGYIPDFGGCIAGKGDLNNDGINDFVISNPYYGDFSSGALYIYLGGENLDETPEYIIYGTRLNSHFGYSVSIDGDINGDGYDDILVGAPAYWSDFYIYYGGETITNTSPVHITEEEDDDWLGESVDIIGDLNGDGKDEFLVGAPQHITSDSAKAYLFYGGNHRTIGYENSIKFVGPHKSSQFGRWVTGLEDLNNDGYIDFAILGIRQLNVYLGNQENIYENPLALLSNEFVEYESFTNISSPGDMNNDGFSDFILSLENSEDLYTGKVNTYLGNSEFSLTPSFTIEGKNEHSYLGYSTDFLGDIDNDGYEDMAFSQIDHLGSTGQGKGTVYIYSTSNISDVGNDYPVKTNFFLSQNYPNPFNPTTTIKFSIPSVETTRRVVSTKLIVYDILGREIRSLVNEVKAPGTHEVQFDASHLASGIYFYRLIAGDFVQTRKMILLR